MNQAIGRRFPDFDFVDHDGQNVKLSQYAGKFPLILSFYRGHW
ncbi:MAG TPA: redoxin domain-containing protein [Candidatus Eisenbacteria bacterium]|nr:redoxin domain-containing protein [Candidatus Eisenbacteria bacterium]